LHVFFFFQAEDGIRDFHVTGVQTCALPISTAVANPRPALDRRYTDQLCPTTAATPLAAATPSSKPSRRAMITGARPFRPSSTARSEERRVGKECRSRRAPRRYEGKGSNVTR